MWEIIKALIDITDDLIELATAIIGLIIIIKAKKDKE
jgi:hypothetical protein